MNDETKAIAERLRELLAKASERPWHVGDDAGTTDGIWSDTATGYDREEGAQMYLVAWCHGDWRADEDAALIVEAVNALPDLLDALTRLEQAETREKALRDTLEYAAWEFRRLGRDNSALAIEETLAGRGGTENIGKARALLEGGQS